MHRLLRSSLPVLALAALLAPPAPAQSVPAPQPEWISFQGRITDAAGNPVPDGSLQMTFAIYDTDTGGTPLWTETHTVVVNAGLYSAQLGSINDFSSLSLDMTHGRWLGVKAGSDDEMAPRYPLTGAPYARLALGAENAVLFDGLPSSAFAAASHVHAATHITSGILSSTRGGTGVSGSGGAAHFLRADGGGGWTSGPLLTGDLPGGPYLAKDAADTSASGAAGNLYLFTSNATTGPSGAVKGVAGAAAAAQGTFFGLWGEAGTGDNDADGSPVSSYGVRGYSTAVSQVGGGLTQSAGVFGEMWGSSDQGLTYAYGVWGRAFGAQDIENYGVRGDAAGLSNYTNYGVYGSASGAAVNWAGFFAGDLRVTGDSHLDSVVSGTWAATPVAAAYGGTGLTGSADATHFLRADGSGGWTSAPLLAADLPAGSSSYLARNAADTSAAAADGVFLYTMTNSSAVAGSGALSATAGPTTAATGSFWGLRGESAVSDNTSEGNNVTNYGVQGIAQSGAAGGMNTNYGVRGESSGNTAFNYGLYGYATGTGGGANNYGARVNATGTDAINYGLYAAASGGVTNWAGYFNGDVYVQGNLSSSGNASLSGNLSASGNVTLGNATTDTVTMNGTIQGDSPLVFEGTPDTNQLTLAVAALMADRTITLPDATGTVITTGNLSDITAVGTVASGTWNGAAIGVGYGGTGASSAGAAGSVAYSTGAAYAFSDAGTSGQVLKSGGSGAPTWGAVDLVETTGTLAVSRGGTGLTSSGSAGSFLRSNGTGWVAIGIQSGDVPSGSAYYVQNQTAVAQAAGFRINGSGTLNDLTANGNVVLGDSTADTIGIAGTILGQYVMRFEGATNDTYETTLAVEDPTADRTITFPNVSGTVITTGNTVDLGSYYLAKNAHDTSTASYGGYLYTLQNNAATGGTGALQAVAGATGAPSGAFYGVRGEAHVGDNTDNGASVYNYAFLGQANGASSVVGATTFNYGLRGLANGGVTAGATTNFGVRGEAIGGAGSENYGIYGQASGGAVNWAGYFEGDVNVTSDLNVASTATIGSTLTANGNVVLGNTTTDTITVTGTLLGQYFLRLEGATNNGFDTAFAIADPTASRILTFPDTTGTVITTGNLSDIGSYFNPTYLMKDAHDESTAAYGGPLYEIINTSTASGTSAIRGTAGASGAETGYFYGVAGNSNVDDTGGTGNVVSNHGLYGLASGAAQATGCYTYNHGVKGYAAGSSSNGATINYGLYGQAHGIDGVINYGAYGTAVSSNSGGTNYGVYGIASNAATNYAGYFNGNVTVTGTLSKGSGTFKIDHPLDPENRYLSHSFVESPDMMNVYNGNVTLDADGEAVVTLPDWLEALNRDFRYQLTCVGGFAPVYVAEKVSGNRFKIAGGRPGLEVSWQITGIRRDPYARQNPIRVEEEKSGEDRGKYLHPEAYGQPLEMGIGYLEASAISAKPGP